MNTKLITKLEAQDLPLIYPLKQNTAVYKPKIGFKKNG